MGDEWFKDKKDLDAAAEEALRILNAAETDESRRKRLILIFVKAFKGTYSYCKKHLIMCQDLPDRVMGNITSTPISTATYEFLQSAAHYVHSSVSSNDQKSIASNLGNALGYFLASVEYGIVSSRFGSVISNEKSYFRDLNIKNKVGFAESIAADLKKMNKSIKPEFIRRRLEKIAKKHGTELNEWQKKILAYIVAVFR